MMKIVTASAVALVAAGIALVIVTKPVPQHLLVSFSAPHAQPEHGPVQPCCTDTPLHVHLQVNHGLSGDSPTE